MSRFSSAAQSPAFRMGVATTLSRGTGLLRTITLASAIGVTTVGDAYNTANTAPTMLFMLIAGGTLSAVVVPLLVQTREQSYSQEREHASLLLTVAFGAGALASALMWVTAPILARGFTAQASARSDYANLVSLTITWLRMFSPQVALYAISTVSVAIMAAQKKLVLGALAPVVTNLLTIGTIGLFWLRRPTVGAPLESTDRAILGWGTTLAVAAMVVIQLWGACRCVPAMRFFWRKKHPALSALRSAAGWMTLYVTVNQIGLALVFALASRVSGGVTAYQWAFMVMQLPYAIVAVSLISALTPALSKSDRTGCLAETAAESVSAMLTTLLPASVLLFVLAKLLSLSLVGDQGANLISAAAKGFSFSLVPFSLFQVLSRIAYVLRRPSAPALTNIAVNVTNVGVAVLGFQLLRGDTRYLLVLSVAHAASYVVGVAFLATYLRREFSLSTKTLLQGNRKTVFSTIGMAFLLYFGMYAIPTVRSRSDATVALACLTFAASISYVSMRFFRSVFPKVKLN